MATFAISSMTVCFGLSPPLNIANDQPGLKAHWFRHSALVRRWREAVYTRREEMYRTLQSYKANRVHWLACAEGHEALGNGGAAAYARRCALSCNTMQISLVTFAVNIDRRTDTYAWRARPRPGSRQIYIRFAKSYNPSLTYSRA